MVPSAQGAHAFIEGGFLWGDPKGELVQGAAGEKPRRPHGKYRLLRPPPSAAHDDDGLASSLAALLQRTAQGALASVRLRGPVSDVSERFSEYSESTRLDELDELAEEEEGEGDAAEEAAEGHTVTGTGTGARVAWGVDVVRGTS